MGGRGYTPQDWHDYARRTNVQNKTVNQIFTSTNMKKDLNPFQTYRESRDSDALPMSTPIIIGDDVTGSMAHLQDRLIKECGDILVKEMYSRKPVSDPQMAFYGIGDAYCDSAPLQVTQFESDSRVAEQLSSIYFEQGGGGNGEESYHLAWWFALKHVKFDAWEKRGKKGYIFTIGNDGCPSVLKAYHIQEVFGDTVDHDIPIKELIDMVSRRWEVFHIHLGDFGYSNRIQESWKSVLGERFIVVPDVDQVTKTIISTLQVLDGNSVDDVADSWGDQKAALVLRDSLKNIKGVSDRGGLVKF